MVQLPPPQSTLRWCRIHVARYALRANLSSQPANFDLHIQHPSSPLWSDAIADTTLF